MSTPRERQVKRFLEIECERSEALEQLEAQTGLTLGGRWEHVEGSHTIDQIGVDAWRMTCHHPSNFMEVMSTGDGREDGLPVLLRCRRCLTYWVGRGPVGPTVSIVHGPEPRWAIDEPEE